MYKITSEIVKYLSDHTKVGDIPGVDEDIQKPFVPRNLHAIGFIDPYGATGTVFDYVVEVDHSVKNMGYDPMIDGFWIYKRTDLKLPSEPVEIPRQAIDPNTKNPEEMFNITDCCVVPPSYIEKLTCRAVKSIQELLKLEP